MDVQSKPRRNHLLKRNTHVRLVSHRNTTWTNRTRKWTVAHVETPRLQKGCTSSDLSESHPSPAFCSSGLPGRTPEPARTPVQSPAWYATAGSRMMGWLSCCPDLRWTAGGAAKANDFDQMLASHVADDSRWWCLPGLPQKNLGCLNCFFSVEDGAWSQELPSTPATPPGHRTRPGCPPWDSGPQRGPGDRFPGVVGQQTVFFSRLLGVMSPLPDSQIILSREKTPRNGYSTWGAGSHEVDIQCLHEWHVRGVMSPIHPSSQRRLHESDVQELAQGQGMWNWSSGSHLILKSS